ncbi:hypothetical protein CkaCkLH20_13028 [Colletotrichum karsti]|uniref:Uncharacterized protein n=1 Tax=Colletotrichum karsti TaxID=1095194 RepID=A0A9P6LEF3_9PEZI|nr:uncharacterized protein CkaCkLH20_13028 [Colletotrichum karsti]KAF9869490.1 hypothetical protein CkaCkLH20_13028 [Colletotrichum karsti]
MQDLVPILARVGIALRDFNANKQIDAQAFLKEHSIPYTTSSATTATSDAASQKVSWVSSPLDVAYLEALIPPSNSTNDVPSPSNHALSPPNDVRPSEGAPSFSATEWAEAFRDTARCLSREATREGSSALPSQDFARPRFPDTNSPWENLLVIGADESPAWEMIAVLETAHHHVGCLVADQNPTKALSSDGILRSELLSMLVLLHWRLNLLKKPNSGGRDPSVTVTTFTRARVRVSQAYIDWSNDEPILRVVNRLDKSLKDLTGASDAARACWLDVLSWLCFTSTENDGIRVEKQGQSGHGWRFEQPAKDRVVSGSSDSSGTSGTGSSGSSRAQHEVASPTSSAPGSPRVDAKQSLA